MLTRSLNQLNPAHTLWSCFFKVYFNNILLSAPSSNKREGEASTSYWGLVGQKEAWGPNMLHLFLFLATLPLPGEEGGGGFFHWGLNLFLMAPSMCRSSKWCLCFMFCYQNVVCICLLFPACHLLCPSHLNLLILNTHIYIWWGMQIMKSWSLTLCNSL
jgi:hypothetical protein